MQERELFIAALEIDDLVARQQYVDQSCAADPALRKRIERLLNRVSDESDFLDRPAADFCVELVDEVLPQAPFVSRTENCPTVVGEANHRTSSQIEQSPILVETQVDELHRVATPGEIDKTSLAPGTLFGRYRIQHVLGSGGMGVVYLAWDTRLDRQVALKIPRFDTDGKLRLIERFRREAKVMASVQHRNLCPIINVDEQGGRHYLTMAYIDGKPLSQLIRNGSSFAAAQIAEWTSKLAMALDATHGAGIVHRDLKPANIIIDKSGEPILMDFGLAWMAHETDARVTIAGAIIGTPAYMSPEQAECEPERVGAASDIYSLGIVLYELLAGCPVRTGSVTRVLYQLMHETPLRPSEIRSGVDLRLEEICLKAIARRPEDRFATAAEFAEALAGGHIVRIVPEAGLPSVVGTNTVDDSKPQLARRSRKKIVLGYALLLGICGFAALVVQRNAQSPLTGSGQSLTLAPIGHVLAAVNFKYAETPTGFTGTWSANAMPAWQGTFTAKGLRPAGHYYTPEACRHDFSGLAGGVLPAGTYFTMYHVCQNDQLTLKAFDSTDTVISSPWLNRKPLSQWGGGSGAGFPGLPVVEDMPGWDWNASTGTYSFVGNPVTQSLSLTIALSSCRDIKLLDVTRNSNKTSFGLLAPAADLPEVRFDKEQLPDK